MTINKMKIKIFGKVGIVYRVLDKNGEVVQVFDSIEEAVAYVGK